MLPDDLLNDAKKDVSGDGLCGHIKKASEWDISEQYAVCELSRPDRFGLGEPVLHSESKLVKTSTRRMLSPDQKGKLFVLMVKFYIRCQMLCLGSPLPYRAVYRKINSSTF